MIPGRRARAYLRDRDPGFDWPKKGLTGGSLRWLIAYQLVAVVALGITVATLGLPSTAQTSAEGAHLGFGYPISFVWVDKTVFNASDYPHTYLLNPWEDLGLELSGWRFVADWFVVTAVSWAGLWFLRRAFTSSRTSPSPG